MRELRSFAASLRQDEAAVAAALTEGWSNGPVEGQVDRLKMIRHAMYGRAGLQLPRRRCGKQVDSIQRGRAGSDRQPASTLRKNLFSIAYCSLFSVKYVSTRAKGSRSVGPASHLSLPRKSKPQITSLPPGVG